MSVGDILCAVSFRIWLGILSGPYAFIGLILPSSFFTPGAVITGSSMGGYACSGQDPDKNLTDAYTDKMWTVSMCMGVIGNCCGENQMWPVGPGKSENIGGVRALDALWCILAILLM